MMMDQRIFYAAGTSAALDQAVHQLKRYAIPFTRTPDRSVTHLLLPAPCREDMSELMKKLSLDVTVIGGKLDRPEFFGYRCIDLLEDEGYLCQNAAITAHCALQVAAQRLPITLEDCPILVIGWGRIGKCLSALLRQSGSQVSIAARKEKDRAMIRALGYEAEDPQHLDNILRCYRAIFNTVPEPILSQDQLAQCRPDCLKIELASKPGLIGDDVIQALGLPSKMAPESSGKLIARSVLRMLAQKEV